MKRCGIWVMVVTLCGLMMTACGGGSGASSNTAPSSSATATASETATASADVLKIEIATDPGGVIRSDIGRQTFGSGIAFNTGQLRWTMDNLTNDTTGKPVSSKTSDAMKGLNLGTLRFPNGDSSFQYVAEDPQASYPMLSAVNKWNRYLTPTEIINYTASDKLNMERLFEVNTVFWLQKGNTSWDMRYLNDAWNTKGAAPILNTSYMATAATRAADWIRADNGQTSLWEVGNEDWSRWNGAQHAEIFYAFQEKMKAARPDIKLLAQGLGQDYNGNTPASWFNALKKKLEDNGKINSVYAYSVHQYVQGEPYTDDELNLRRRKQTQDMLAEVAESKPVNDVKALLGVDSATASTRNWKLWITEFNVHQPSGKKNVDGIDLYEPAQDMGHALVIADWTGKMLEQNVERMFMHSLDHHPEFALVQYANLGADIENPRVTVPGFAYAIYAQAFGKTMVRNTITGNPILKAPNGKSYPQLGAYSSVSADGKSLRVMVINRNLTDAVRFNLNTQNAPAGRKLANGQYAFSQLSANNLVDSNAAGELVKWSAPVYRAQTSAGLENVTVAPASANLFIFALQ